MGRPVTGVVLVAVAEHVATITLNRPEVRNAINGELGAALARAVGDCETRDDVDVMVLTGADPAFCAGADLTEISVGRDPAELLTDPDDPYRRDDVGKFAFRGPFPPRTKLLIGAINGPAITGGFELALNCDLLVASDRARFADTHARVGVMPGWGLTVLLVEAVGLRRARELSATGNFCSAEQALTWGLVNHVVPHDELLPFTRTLALAAVHNDTRGVRRMLATYGQIAASIYDSGWDLEDRVNREWWNETFDPSELARRARGVIERGRRQVEPRDEA
jgi:enoyl-CoA hydratase/carnithine racemase